MSFVLPNNNFKFNDSIITEQQLNDIYLSLTSHLAQNINCYLLLDFSLRNISELAQDYVFYDYIDRNPKNQFRFPLIHESLDPIISPCLFKLDLTDSEMEILLKQSIYLSFEEKQINNITAGQGRVICAWLFSTFNGDYVANYLAKTCLQHHHQEQYFFRFYDPAVLPACITLLSKSAQQRIFAPVSHWVLLNGDGELNSYQFLEQKRFYSGALGITDSEFTALEHISIENRVLLDYRINYENQPRYNEAMARDIIRNAFNNAIANNVTNKDDLRLFAYQALTIHPMFFQHPKVQKQLTFRNNDRYQQRISELQPEWTKIRQDLESGEYYGM